MIHQKLKELRKAKKISQEEVAHYFNMSQNCYSKIETGKTKLDHDRLIAFANYFNVKPSELLILKGVNLQLDTKEKLEMAKQDSTDLKMKYADYLKDLIIAKDEQIKNLMQEIDILNNNGNIIIKSNNN